MSQHRQSGMFQRWAAVNRGLCSLFVRGEGDFRLLKPARSAILVSNRRHLANVGLTFVNAGVPAKLTWLSLLERSADEHFQGTLCPPPTSCSGASTS
jgi:hypothetical protein